jgi:hypothetical protein
MSDRTNKKRLDLEFHPDDFEAIKEASRIANVETDDFCKLAIHVVTRRTLGGEWPGEWPLHLRGSGDIENTSPV